eukprot:scaffold1978_cov381-Prasinococcus_capsulatus_cf.AAC.1
MKVGGGGERGTSSAPGAARSAKTRTVSLRGVSRAFRPQGRPVAHLYALPQPPLRPARGDPFHMELRAAPLLLAFAPGGPESGPAADST